jgi:hypothetical protein
MYTFLQNVLWNVDRSTLTAIKTRLSEKIFAIAKLSRGYRETIAKLSITYRHIIATFSTFINRYPHYSFQARKPPTTSFGFSDIPSVHHQHHCHHHARNSLNPGASSSQKILSLFFFTQHEHEVMMYYYYSLV